MIDGDRYGRPQRYGFLLIEGYALMSAASAVEPLRAANLLSERRLYDLSFVSDQGGWTRSSVSGAFETVPVSEAVGDFDVLFVVAGGNPLTYRDNGVLAWLRRLARSGVALGGISGGAAILAAAGVMTSRRFTIHWQHIDVMREIYPEALIERRLFVIDRDRFTCAGGMAPLDMAHALIASDHGVELARAVSDWFIHTGIRRAEAPQQLDPARKYDLHHPALVAIVDLMTSHIADPLNLDDLAHLAGIGTRQLERLTKQQLGQSVMQFYRSLRLEKADELLQQSNLPLVEVALATGFSNRSHFSRAFQAHFGFGPASRRKQRRHRQQLLSQCSFVR
ncbi:GlxA family transcriptional regulator [Mesorhizobium sp. M5C.F.Cr.IN.023.01.1.1]|uniref:GlxA family transcriptional regulator n=1 Tax=Mesorhizobium sp. M5C.F.Cr.IN.023.01.1.1 TaxID=2496768 RepID=UPI000FCB1DB2|nr:GlxA family transcriptional regulator [Mesorhizobium sp. M5C.F.Cr.IN.023.01.1.1]RUV68132.1 GlxA family transcriptional regulator [Mesorhizobium sp. M5C.F.Cr.IN.023.01.1.1]